MTLGRESLAWPLENLPLEMNFKRNSVPFPLIFKSKGFSKLPDKELSSLRGEGESAGWGQPAGEGIWASEPRFCHSG